MTSLIEAGLDVARLNFSHGDHEAHGEVFDRLKQVSKAKNSNTAILLDTKGPEIRTAMLKDHRAIDLVAGQSIIVENKPGASGAIAVSLLVSVMFEMSTLIASTGGVSYLGFGSTTSAAARIAA